MNKYDNNSYSFDNFSLSFMLFLIFFLKFHLNSPLFIQKFKSTMKNIIKAVNLIINRAQVNTQFNYLKTKEKQN